MIIRKELPEVTKCWLACVDSKWLKSRPPGETVFYAVDFGKEDRSSCYVAVGGEFWNIELLRKCAGKSVRQVRKMGFSREESLKIKSVCKSCDREGLLWTKRSGEA